MAGTATIAWFGIPSAAYDSDAQAFFTAAGITDDTQKSAVNQLVLDLKSAGIWTKMVAIYPIVGGTASSHSYNLKNPSLYQLSFIGSPAHSSGGVDWNGSSQYADTGLIPSSVLTLNSTHICYYSRDNYVVPVGSSSCEMGCEQNNGGAVGVEPRLDFFIKLSNNTTFIDNYDFSTTRISFVETDSLGFYLTTRASSTDHRAYKNTTQYSNTATSTLALPNQSLFIGAFHGNNNTTNYYSQRQCAFASVGNSLTSTDAGNFYTAVQNFQTTLGRQV